MTCFDRKSIKSVTSIRLPQRVRLDAGDYLPSRARLKNADVWVCDEHNTIWIRRYRWADPPTETRDSVKNKTREPPCSENTKHLMFPLNLQRFHPLSPAPLSVCDLRLCWDDLQRSRQHLNGKMFNKIECLWCVLGILIYIRPTLPPVYIESRAALLHSHSTTLEGWVKRHSSRLKRAPHINQITCFLCVRVCVALLLLLFMPGS